LTPAERRAWRDNTLDAFRVWLSTLAATVH